MTDQRLRFESLGGFLLNPNEHPGERQFIADALLDHRRDHGRWPRFVLWHPVAMPYDEVPPELRAQGFRGFGDRLLASVDTSNGGANLAWDPEVDRVFVLDGYLGVSDVERMSGRAG